MSFLIHFVSVSYLQHAFRVFRRFEETGRISRHGLPQKYIGLCDKARVSENRARPSDLLRVRVVKHIFDSKVSERLRPRQESFCR